MRDDFQPTAPRDETIRSSNNHNVAPFLRFAISNEKIAMSFHHLKHCSPLKIAMSPVMELNQAVFSSSRDTGRQLP